MRSPQPRALHHQKGIELQAAFTDTKELRVENMHELRRHLVSRNLILSAVRKLRGSLMCQRKRLFRSVPAGRWCRRTPRAF
jgi:hypothetical protein